MDWFSSMQQTFKYVKVDPATWKDDKVIEDVVSCTINWDLSDDTLGYATLDCTEPMDECYVRIYLCTVQNGEKKNVPLGTFLAQTPSVSFDGKARSVSIDAYSPLAELSVTMPPVGFALLKGENIMKAAARLCMENMRAPVVEASSEDKLTSDFVANLDDKWLSFLIDLMADAKHSFLMDELGCILFAPEQDTASLQPVVTFDDGNSSILYPDIEDERDLYGVPNVVEVVYSSNVGYKYSRAENKDENSPVSIVRRGREVVHRDSNPNFPGIPSQKMLDEYATQLLRNLSCLEHTLTYTHGYYPVHIGDCVMLDYRRAGIRNVKAKVVSQSIKCETGCPVEETAVYTTQLWR